MKRGDVPRPRARALARSEPHREGRSAILLVGDIGGTKTDLAVLASGSSLRAFSARRRFHSADFPNLAVIAREFTAELDAPVTHACFDVAGPVVDGRASLTNLPWEVSAEGLRRELKLEDVWVINDLAAVAHAVPLLRSDDLHTIDAGHRVEGGAMAVIAPGTGLGEAFLVWDGSSYRPYPSEGGHVDFAPPTAAHADLLAYLQQRFEHVSYELVCSGRGIPHLYDYYRDRARARESPELAAQLATVDDRTPLIIEGALRGNAPDPLCAMALRAFVSILGAEAGNLALKVLATGGVFVGGGIAPRIVRLLEGGQFTAAFRRKGRFAQMLARVPVHVITCEDVALIGAASYGRARVGGAFTGAASL
jgi:glucokinase